MTYKDLLLTVFMETEQDFNRYLHLYNRGFGEIDHQSQLFRFSFTNENCFNAISAFFIVIWGGKSLGHREKVSYIFFLSPANAPFSSMPKVGVRSLKEDKDDDVICCDVTKNNAFFW